MFLLLVVAASCDPYNYGFEKNPAYVPDIAFKSIQVKDQNSFLEVSGKEALCLYGNPEGLSYLKSKISMSEQQIRIVRTVREKEHHQIPVYVGYWSYYHERHQFSIYEKKGKALLLEALIDCEYGTEGEKDENLIFRKPKKYKKKECRLVKIIPEEFESLPMTSRCEVMKVEAL